MHETLFSRTGRAPADAPDTPTVVSETQTFLPPRFGLSPSSFARRPSAFFDT